MTFVLPPAGPLPAPNTIGIRGRITLRLIERPDATTDAAFGRDFDYPSAFRRPKFSTRPHR